MKLIKLILIGILLLFSTGYMLEIIDLFQNLPEFSSPVKQFAYGGLAFLVFWFLFRKRFMYTFSVFEHELTHVLVAKLFFLKTLRFEVSPRKHVEGQVVVGVEGRGTLTRFISVFFSLAPYYLPTLTLLVFVLYALFGSRIAPVFFFAVGFTAAYHFWTTFREFGFHQADIQKHGEYFSTAFVLLGNLIFLGVIMEVVVYSNFQDVPGFLVRGLLNVFM
ncbi:hypothetical protein CSA56_07350 [candidate division KSB3 bacterium]|uniref:Peptidase M50 n=1 Tax=candidate division KSB3 bacterium TaxID=2044937 RepID=A0A2G6KG02_9BACT|nr:MAG: hypothetical protein CSA56_07350 [candidate division KSB3 bacterium]